MNIFKNKVNTYKVNCSLDMNVRVRQFAEKHSAMNTVVETRAHGSLLSTNVRVTTSFKSTESETTIYRAFLEEFRGYDIRINNKTISVYKGES